MFRFLLKSGLFLCFVVYSAIEAIETIETIEAIVTIVAIGAIGKIVCILLKAISFCGKRGLFLFLTFSSLLVF